MALLSVKLPPLLVNIAKVVLYKSCMNKEDNYKVLLVALPNLSLHSMQ